jgi:dihydrofolate synthase/folylpolyglutamate synthase
MFQRIGTAAYKADLSNIQQLCEKLNHPEKKLKYIHIAGTNGKGSVSNMLAAIFQKNGYKTGLFTSPHLIDFRERIRVNGQMISKQYITKFVNQYKPLFDEVRPSFFEWTTALAFQYFLDKKVDIVILETGMGGRLDSTNVVIPELSIITNIGEDHKQFLGDTLEKIAFEKAGIIKPNVPILISEYQKEIKDVFEQKAEEFSAPLFYAQDLIKIEKSAFKNNILEVSYKYNYIYLNKILDKSKLSNKTNLKINLDKYNLKIFNNLKYNLDKSKNKEFKLKSKLSAQYQIKNIRCVLAACEIMNTLGWKLSQNKIHSAIYQTPQITGFRGRWEIIQKNPLVILDIAHNKPGIISALQQLKHHNYQKLHIVFGIVKDKEVDEILNLLHKKSIYYVTQASVPRSMPVDELFSKFKTLKLKSTPFNNVCMAINAALFDASKNDCILIFGSAFLVADALSCFNTFKISTKSKTYTHSNN